MRARTLGFAAVLVLLAFAAPEAGAAWPWSGSRTKKKTPKPIDSPVVRKDVPEHHKPGNRMRHARAKKYDRPQWGAEWDRTLDTRNRRTPHPWVTGRDE